jgi:hypothetical protein
VAVKKQQGLLAAAVHVGAAQLVVLIPPEMLLLVAVGEALPDIPQMEERAVLLQAVLAAAVAPEIKGLLLQ